MKRFFIILFLSCNYLSNAFSIAIESENNQKIPFFQVTEMQKKHLVIKDKEVVLCGNKNSKVKMFVYGSFSCPHCADFFTKIIPQIIKEYNNNQISIVYRTVFADLPSLRAQQILKCSAEELTPQKYFNLVNVLYKESPNFLYSKKFLEKLEMIYLKNVKKNKKAFYKCIEAKEIENVIINDEFEISKEMDLKATPAVFINNTLFFGSIPYKFLSSIIKQEYNKK